VAISFFEIMKFGYEAGFTDVFYGPNRLVEVLIPNLAAKKGTKKSYASFFLPLSYIL
jgi:hypothetical protein